MYDRAIGRSAGLAAKTVAAIRKRSSDDAPQSNARVGRDGRVRPLDSTEGRQRAAEILTDRPETSLRDAARAAGISPATVLDVRKRLERGEAPVPVKPSAAANGSGAHAAGNGASVPAPRSDSGSAAWSAATRDPAVVVEKLLRDP